jgi:hypothetical protein
LRFGIFLLGESLRNKRVVRRLSLERPCEGMEIANALNVDLPNELSKFKIVDP